MTVETLMSGSPVTLDPQQTLRDAIELMRSRKVRHLPVVEDSRLVGIVTDRDVKRATPSILSGTGVDEFERVLLETKIAQIMTREPVSVTRTMPLRNAVALLLQKRVGALPVVDGTLLVGIITETDMLRALYDMLPPSP